MFGHGDLRLVLLSLIAEKPRHGYDLIRAIEEKFGGAYAPSPGAVYPTLTLLEEQDYIAAEAQSGTKKLYQITEAGRAFLDENAVALRGIQARMDLAAQAFSIHSTPEIVREAIRTLKQALHMRRGPNTSPATGLEAIAATTGAAEPSPVRWVIRTSPTAVSRAFSPASSAARSSTKGARPLCPSTIASAGRSETIVPAAVMSIEPPSILSSHPANVPMPKEAAPAASNQSRCDASARDR